MILITGLGNPDKQYENTRHNIGFMALDLLKDKISPQDKWTKNSKLLGEIAKTDQFLLLKPSTYMNLSGKAVKAVMQMYKIPLQNIWIIHDDLDIDLGRVKIQIGGGSAGHNGIKSIIEELSSNNFTRWRVGIGKPHLPEYDIAKFVLDKFTNAEITKVDEILTKIVDSVQYASQHTVIASMNKYN